MSEFRRSGEALSDTFTPGERVRRDIQNALNPKTDFPEASGELDDLLEMLPLLSDVVVTGSELGVAINDGLELVAQNSARSRLLSHRTQLRAKRAITVNDEGEHEWQPVENGQITAIESAWEEYFPEDYRVESSPLSGDETRQAYELSIGLFRVQVGRLLLQVNELIPDPVAPPQPLNRRQKLARKITRAAEVPYVPYPDEYAQLIPADAERLRRRLRKLNDLLGTLVEPTETLAKLYLDELSDMTVQLTAARIDARMAMVNEAVLKKVKPAEKARPPIDDVSGIDLEDAEELSEQPPIKKSPPREVNQTKETIRMVGKYVVMYPWMGEDEPAIRPMQEVRIGGKKAYILPAIAPRLESISETSRAAGTYTDDDVSEFDQISQHLAKRIAEGVMPWNNTNSVKRVRINRKTMNPDFEGVTVWSSFDISPNAPRVYFTVADMGELAIDRLPPGAKEDDKCLVVVAETDKARQTAVLKFITGDSHSALRHHGSGST